MFDNIRSAYRYGRLSTAPTASMMAGAPVVVIVKEPSPRPVGEPLDQSKRLITEEDEAIHSWQAVCLGSCVVRVVEVPIVEQITVVVASVLRRDIDASLAPVLVVLRAPIDSSLPSGIKV